MNEKEKREEIREYYFNLRILKDVLLKKYRAFCDLPVGDDLEKYNKDFIGIVEKIKTTNFKIKFAEHFRDNLKNPVYVGFYYREIALNMISGDAEERPNYLGRNFTSVYDAIMYFEENIYFEIVYLRVLSSIDINEVDFIYPLN